MSEGTKRLRLAIAKMIIRMPRWLVWLRYGGKLEQVDGLTIDPKAQLVGRMINSYRVPGQLPTVAESRAQLDTLFRLFDMPAPGIAGPEDIFVPGPAGDIPCRIYRPLRKASAGLPVVAFFHGGGWIQGGLDSHDGTCRRLAAWAECMVVSVDYRLAPEHKFPAAVDDCFAAYQWLTANAASLGGDNRCIAVAGDSAGGNLAAVVSQLCRDQNVQLPVMQVLLYPGIDFAMNTPSHGSLANAYMLTRERMDWYAGLYLNSEQDKDDPRASPNRATDLSGLPPALIISAGFDPLRDEARDYAEALRAAGVAADYTCYEGMIHAFSSMPAAYTQADESLRQAAGALKTAFSR
jgi:acetyl esterase